jgi:hypothetical protein
MSQLFLCLALISLPLSTSHNITPLLHIMSYPSLCFLVTETFNLLLWLKEHKMKLEKSSSIQISIFPQSFQICSNLKQNHHPPPSESETKFHLNLFKSVHSLERSFLEKSSWIVTEQSLLDQGMFSETALVVNRFSDCVKMYG